MRYLRHAALLGCAATAIACSWKQMPIPILSDQGSTTALVGEWEGEYTSRDTGRNGSITFQLANDKDSAFGDVLMVPRATNVQMTVHDRPQTIPIGPRGTPEPLKIRFVRLEGDHVSGTLDSYADPDCGCRVITTFIGAFTDLNTIVGTFTTKGASSEFSHYPAEGQWKVVRQASRSTSREE